MSGLDSALFATNEYVEEHAFVSRISSFFFSCDTVGYMNRVKLAIDILTESVRNKEEKRWCYNIVKWNNKG